ncbi:MAG: hypothetical protein AB8B74_07475 [Crocinitomicaceae bacterium]
MLKNLFVLIIISSCLTVYAQRPDLDGNLNMENIKFLKLKGYDQEWELFDQNGGKYSKNLTVKKRFDSNGKLILRWNYNFDIVESIDSNIFIYDTNNLQIIQLQYTIYNPKGEKLDPIMDVDDLPKTKKWTKHFSDNGVLLYQIRHPQWKFENADTTFFTYYENGNLKSKHSDRMTLEILYDNNNRVQKETEFAYRNNIRTFFYSELGLIDSVLTISESKKGEKTFIRALYNYNSKGLLSSFIKYSNDKLLMKQEYEYNDQGLLILLRRYDCITGLVRSIDRRKYLYYK